MRGYSIIKTSIKGDKPVNQDAVRTYEDDGYVIMSLADGLGSSKHSDQGAKEICVCVINEIRQSIRMSKPLSVSNVLSQWSRRLERKGLSQCDCRTTNSFVIVNKKDKRVTAASVGDSMICIVCDGRLEMMVHEKDFANITESVSDGVRYRLRSFAFEKTVRVFIASDGICDELEVGAMADMLEYLCMKYQGLPENNRNRVLAGEIKRTFARLNADDKTMILMWNQ